jgi:hypothetical protein
VFAFISSDGSTSNIHRMHIQGYPICFNLSFFTLFYTLSQYPITEKPVGSSSNATIFVDLLSLLPISVEKLVPNNQEIGEIKINGQTR